jgi:exodeoxyribonuclease VII large subunit
VQGDGSAEQIAACIGRLNGRSGEYDAILLARGGGSLEDLWEFNEEIVARAIFASTIPVVTGVGHEVDVSIADLVADYHAHTPTEAAQVLTAQWRNAGDVLAGADARLRKGLRDTLAYYKQRVTSIERHEVFRRPLDHVNKLRQVVDDREKDLRHTAVNRLHLLQRRLSDSARRLDKHRPAALIDRLRQRLDHRGLTLAMALKQRVQLLNVTVTTADRRLRGGTKVNHQSLSKALDSLETQLRLVGPEQVLKRGYSITSNKKTGQVIRSASQVKGGETIVTRLADGQIESVTDDPGQPKLFD